MFEDIDKQEEKQNNNLKEKTDKSLSEQDIQKKGDGSKKSEVEDIFSEVDKNEKPKEFQVKEKKEEEDVLALKQNDNIKKILLLIALVLGFITICLSGYYAYVLLTQKDEPQDIIIDDGFEPKEKENASDNNFEKNKPEEDKKDNTEKNQKDKDTDKGNIIDKDGNPDKNKKQEEETENGDESENNPDSDGDGLSDSTENVLGTNINSIDTDSDGLSDYEEVNKYNTDPLSPDSDEDGYNDGVEIRGGYNPNGAGKL